MGTILTKLQSSGRMVLALTILALLAGPAVPKASAAFALQSTFTFDQSNTYASDNYGTIEVWTDPTAGMVKFVVDAFVVQPLYGTTQNFGIQQFGFNTDLNILATNIVTTDLVGTNLNWSVGFNQQIDGFGSFTVNDAGTGNSRGDPIVVTISGLTEAQATLAHFEFKSVGPQQGQTEVYFVAHVAGFDNGRLSHYIGASLPGDPPDDDEDTDSVVPEPSTIVLALTGVFGLGLTRLRRHRRKPDATV